MNKAGLCVTAMLISIAVGGCQKQATGQVAAVVNGDEITLQEINAELAGLNVPKSADRKAVQQQALQRIIDRRLLAQAAKDHGIDKGSEYLIRRRQLDDALLVQLLGQKTGNAFRAPSQGEIENFMTARPLMFKDRKVYTLERLQFAMPDNPSVLSALESAHTMSAVEAELKRLNISFQKGNGQLDTARVPADLLDRILALPQGEPFVLPENGMVTVSVITNSAPVPLVGDEARPFAVQAIREQYLAKGIREALQDKRGKAKIDYQSGFAPAAKKVQAPTAQ